MPSKVTATHLEIHTGKTKKIRAQTSAPTDPEPETGDIYFNTTSGQFAIGIYSVNKWLYVSAQ